MEICFRLRLGSSYFFEGDSSSLLDYFLDTHVYLSCNILLFFKLSRNTESGNGRLNTEEVCH